MLSSNITVKYHLEPVNRTSPFTMRLQSLEAAIENLTDQLKLVWIQEKKEDGTIDYHYARFLNSCRLDDAKEREGKIQVGHTVAFDQAFTKVGLIE